MRGAKTCKKCGKIIVASQMERDTVRRQISTELSVTKWLCVCRDEKKRKRKEID